MFYIFAQIFKYFALFSPFSTFFCPFSEKSHTCPNFVEQALHAYIHTYLQIYHAYHTCHTIYTIHRFCKYISNIPYHAMYTYLHTIFICILYMHTKIPYIYTITHIHTKHSKHRYHKYQIYKYISYHISCHFCLPKCPDILKNFEKILTVDTETENDIILG